MPDRKPDQPVAESPIADVFEGRRPSDGEKAWAETVLAPTLAKNPEKPIGVASGVNPAVRVTGHDLNVQRRQHGAGGGYGGRFGWLRLGRYLGSWDVLLRGGSRGGPRCFGRTRNHYLLGCG